MKRYRESYLDEIVETQGRLFDRATEFFPGVDVKSFVDAYMRSQTRQFIDEGQAYVCTMDAARLAEYFQETDQYIPKAGAPVPGFIPDWIGRFYAYYQWYYAIYSRQVVEEVPVDYLAAAYHGLHDLELELAVRKVGGSIHDHADAVPECTESVDKPGSRD